MKNKNKVFILQHKETMRIYGCFSTRIKAEKYRSNNHDIAIIKVPVD